MNEPVQSVQLDSCHRLQSKRRLLGSALSALPPEAQGALFVWVADTLNLFFFPFFSTPDLHAKVGVTLMK